MSNIMFVLSDWLSVDKNFPHMCKIQYEKLYDYLNGIKNDMNCFLKLQVYQLKL